MRHLQAWLDDYGISVEDQIEVERPGCAWVRTLTASLSFDLEKALDETPGGQSRVPGCCCVQETRLWTNTNGFGFVKTRKSKIAETLLQPLDRKHKMRVTVAEVTPERYRYRCRNQCRSRNPEPRNPEPKNPGT